jgi:methionyl aminopeptidase
MVHGIPNDYILKPGDLLTIDVGTEYENWFVDSARTRIIEGKNELGSKLIEATEEILKAQLAVVKDGCDMLTIVLAAEKIARQYGAKIFSIWGGHGIGDKVHTEPFIPNAFTEGQSHLARCFEENNFKLSRFHAGHTYCIEPVVTFGSLDMIVDPDGWTVRHKDGQLVAHTERTILVLENGIEVLS